MAHGVTHRDRQSRAEMLWLTDLENSSIVAPPDFTCFAEHGNEIDLHLTNQGKDTQEQSKGYMPGSLAIG
jgi:hypothetical protein